MADSAANQASFSPLARIGPRLLGTAAVGSLLGGLVMFLVVAGYNASAGMGFLTILSVCFAAWLFRGTATTTAMPAEHHAMGMHHKAMGMHHKAMGMHHKAMGMHHEAAMGMHHHAMGAAAMMSQPLSASHVIVGGLPAHGHVRLRRRRVRGRAGDAHPRGYAGAGHPGRVCNRRSGRRGLLYVLMLYVFAPLWNTEIVHFTPRVPFFLSRLLFGATVGGWVYWSLAQAGASIRMQTHRPELHGA
jgi:hypothetical protein